MLSETIEGSYTFQDATPATKLYAFLSESIDPRDASVMLPNAHFSTSSTPINNALVHFDAASSKTNVDIFNNDWGHGVSIQRLQDCDHLVSALADSETRREMLNSLRSAIKNQLCSPADDCLVGPSLKASGNHDLEEDDWECGFDTEACSVGIYSGIETLPPGANEHVNGSGMSRAHNHFYLIVRAGAGRAAEEFHAALIEANRNGSPLPDVLAKVAKESGFEDDVAGLLTRVSGAARRNRARIMVSAARALGLASSLMTSIDHSATGGQQGSQVATLEVDCVTNVLEATNAQAFGEVGREYVYFAGCVAPSSSQGIVTANNTAAGYVLFRPTLDQGLHASSWARMTSNLSVENAYFGSVPFVPPRISEDQQIGDVVLGACVDALKSTKKDAGAAEGSPFHVSYSLSDDDADDKADDNADSSTTAEAKTSLPSKKAQALRAIRTVHPDRKWIDSHFTWHAPTLPHKASLARSDEKEGAQLQFDEVVREIPPFCLWGSHGQQGHVEWALEMRTEKMSSVHLTPEVVLLAGCELAKIRSAVTTIVAASAARE